MIATTASLLALLGQAHSKEDQEVIAAAAAGCGILAFFAIGLLVLNVLLLVWTAKDAKARGMDTPVIWMLVVFFLGVVGLVIYLLARPSGEVVTCPKCSNKRMRSLARCPHCGNA
jgi:hypothetical protein